MSRVVSDLQSVFARLQRAGGNRNVDVGGAALILALLYNANGRAGLLPARFRETTQKTAGKELLAFATQVERLGTVIGAGASDPMVQRNAAERLARTIAKLHQTAILWLADYGFSDRAQLEALAQALADSHSKTFANPEVEFLGLASGAARKALRAISENSEHVEIQTRGAPENQRAVVAVRLLAASYKQVTGREPTLTVNSLKYGSPVSGEFFDFVKASFEVLNINVSAEAYIKRWRTERT